MKHSHLSKRLLGPTHSISWLKVLWYIWGDIKTSFTWIHVFWVALPLSVLLISHGSCLSQLFFYILWLFSCMWYMTHLLRMSHGIVIFSLHRICASILYTWMHLLMNYLTPLQLDVLPIITGLGAFWYSTEWLKTNPLLLPFPA